MTTILQGLTRYLNKNAAQELADHVNEITAKATNGIGYNYDYGISNKRYPNGHYSDLGKLPNHPTFSTQSAYSTDNYKGGTWSTTNNGKWVFTPSQDMVRSGATKGLAAYFRQREPNSILMAPVPYNNTVFIGKNNY